MRHPNSSYPSTLFCSLIYRFLLPVLLPIFIGLAGATTAHSQVTFPTRTLPLDLPQITSDLSTAPLEFSDDAKSKPLLYRLPMPDGSDAGYFVEASAVMTGQFHKDNPDIRTYKLFNEQTEAYGRLVISPSGLHALIFTKEGSYFIDPVDKNLPIEHKVFYSKSGDIHGECGFDPEKEEFKGDLKRHFQRQKNSVKSNLSNGTTKRTYQLAITTTGEFYQDVDFGNNILATALAAITQVVSDNSALYELELAVAFTGVVVNAAVYTNPATDPFNPGGSNLTSQAANTLALHYTSGQYDFGHVLHATTSGGSGVAGLGVVCDDGASGTGLQKGRGWSGGSDHATLVNAIMWHEVGHQFDMEHSFNGTGGNCTSNISSTAAYEIASGTTIMSYNGNCQANNNILSGGAADEYFHANSLESAINFMVTHACDAESASGNTPPVVNANPCGGTYTIPKSTPFTLTGTGSDANGDQIYYSWEQYDEDGAGVPTQGFIGATAAGSSIAPLFRSYPPTTSPSRTFPTMSLVAANSYASSFEPLPSVARTLNFHLFGRDWNANGGGTHCQPLAVTVSALGPLAVIAPNGGGTPLTAGAATTVTWNLNGINFLTNVNIRMSTDGGLTYPYLLISNTPAADGSESVTLPAGVTNTSAARMMVESAGNACVVFFDISDSNFSITSNCVAPATLINPDNAVSFPLGDAGLNLGLDNNLGSPITSPIAGAISGTETTTASVKASVECGTLNCTVFSGGPFFFDVYPFQVSVAGSYTFTPTSNFSHAIAIYQGNFSTGTQCTNLLGSSRCHNPPNIITGTVSPVTVTLATGVAYSLASSNFFFGAQTGTYSISFTTPGGGGLYDGVVLPAGYDYTYAAVNTVNGQVALVSASSNFTALPVGTYCVYGAAYKASGATPPALVNPANWVGQTIPAILSGGDCVLFSTNCKPVTVTGGGGCTPPVVNAPTVTPPTCPGSNGIIVVNATGTGALEYSINSGLNWQADASFSGLGTGNYTLVVRLQANPTCLTNYGANPVVFNGPPVFNAPPTGVGVTQPMCLVTTGTIVVNATGGSTLEYSVNNGANWQTSATFSGLMPGNYTVLARLQASPTCVTAYSGNPVVINAVVSSPCLCNAYCAASQTTGTCAGTVDEHFTLVTFNTINNSSTCAQSLPAGYTNYTNVSTSVNTGSTYTLNATNGGPFVGDQCRAWFDWNADGDFTDAGEQFILTGSGTNNAVSWTVSVLVPVGATPGSTRMRIRIAFNGAPPICGASQYGETEDYCVTIVSVCTPPVVNAPPTGVGVTQPTCAVPTGTILVNATGGGTLEYSKDDGSNWQASATFSLLMPGNYPIKVRLQSSPTCTTAYASNPVVINAVPTAPMVTAPTLTQPTCDVTTGEIVVNATGSGALEYSIDNGSNWQGSATFSLLTPGNYPIKVRLQSSPTCTTAYASNPVVINAVPTAPMVTAPTLTQPTCDVTTGEIVVNATGSGALEYSIDNGSNYQASATFSSLAPGNYNIRVRLQSNPTCNAAYAGNPVMINAVPSPPTVSPPPTGVGVTQPSSCAMPTGTIVVNATGSGTLEYSVDDGSNFQISNTFSSLPIGSYDVVVRLQSDPTCIGAYGGNPVVLSPPPGCCLTPTYEEDCMSGDFIESFTFGSFSNLGTGCANPGASNLSNYIGTGPNVQLGETYLVSIEAGTTFEQYFAVYIDFNQNGSYLDAGEFFDFGQAAAGNTVSANILIPAGIATGTRTMRARSSYEDPLTAADGCNTHLSLGEIEDYNLFIFCPSNVAVNALPIPAGTYEADLQLSSAGTVNNGTNVLFRAGTEVELLPNFEIQMGGVLEVVMQGCF